MPNQLEEHLRAVQHSIADIKRQMKESVNVKHYQQLEVILKEYQEEEQILLKEIKRLGGL